MLWNEYTARVNTGDSDAAALYQYVNTTRISLEKKMFVNAINNHQQGGEKNVQPQFTPTICILYCKIDPCRGKNLNPSYSEHIPICVSLLALVLVITCARRALKDSFSREMLFSTTSSLTRLSLCWTCSSCVRMSSDSSTESWACRMNRVFFFFPHCLETSKS